MFSSVFISDLKCIQSFHSYLSRIIGASESEATTFETKESDNNSIHSFLSPNRDNLCITDNLDGDDVPFPDVSSSCVQLLSIYIKIK